MPYRVNSKGVTKRGRKKKKAGELMADAAADENGMFWNRPLYDACHTPYLLSYWEVEILEGNNYLRLLFW